MGDKTSSSEETVSKMFIGKRGEMSADEELARRKLLMVSRGKNAPRPIRQAESNLSVPELSYF